MTTTEIPTVIIGRSSPVSHRPADKVVLGPTSWIGERAWSNAVHHLAHQHRRSSCTPAYHLGRTAETWLAALTPRDESTAAVDPQAA